MESPRTRTHVVRDLTTQYPTLSPALRAYVTRLGVPTSAAEDVVSEVFATVLTLDDDRLLRIENMRAYLYAVARNVAARCATAAARTVALPAEALDRAVPAVAPREVERAESQALARRAFDALTGTQRYVLWSTAVERRTAKEVAAEIGTSVSNVTTMAQRARAALRQHYVSSFVTQSPPPCGTAPEVLARIALGTASRRQEREYARHAEGCERCPDVERQAREDLATGSVAWIMAVGALVPGVVTWGGGDLAAAALAEGTRRLPAGNRGRFAVAAVGVLCAALLLLMVALSDGTRSGGVRATVPLSEVVVSPPTASVTAEPDRLSLAMPAPGGSATWSSAVRSASSGTMALLLEVTPLTADHPSAEPTLSLSLSRDGRSLGGRVALATADGYVYLGEIAPGQTSAIEATLHRAGSDSVQGLSARVLARFVVSTEVPDGAGVGDLLPGTAALPITGTAPWRVLALGMALTVAGAGLVVRRRRR